MESTKEGVGASHSGTLTRIPSLEWLASGVGLLLTVGVFGLIGWQALNDASSSPVITVETTEVSPVAGGYRVIVRAHNTGGAVASQVRIEGTLSRNNGSNEVGDVVLDNIPGHSTREGGLFFTQDPRSGGLTVRAAGFAKP